MYEQIVSSHPAVNSLWQARVEKAALYTDPANEYWGVAFTRRPDGTSGAELIGPSLLPRKVDSHVGDHYWGVEFHSHVTIKNASKKSLLGSTTSLPTDNGYFILSGTRYSIPTFGQLENFASQLLDDGTISSRDDIRRSLDGNTAGYSPRSWQRHIRWVTGLSKKQIEQLKRARHAYFLLQTGKNPTDAAFVAGYSDQAHMTRALQLLRLETPAQIIAQHIKQQ